MNKHKNKNIDCLFPVNLLLKDKKCLIVGGGKVASHKAEILISSGIKPIVVSKSFHDNLLELKKNNLTILIHREFEDNDLHDIYLVFIATNKLKLNSHITALCNKKNILCCSVDKNWHNGTFITPAAFKEKGMTVTISTGGKSCRYARLMKSSIKKFVLSQEGCDLLMIGTDHRYLSLNEREHLHATMKNSELSQMFNNISGIHEFLIVNTCNRVEVLCLVKQAVGIEKLILKLINFDQIHSSKFYIKRGFEAFRHLTLVTSGVYAQLIGENHITSQIKEACNKAEEKGNIGGILTSVVDGALYISKFIRNTLSVAIKPTEIEELAIKYLKSINKLNFKKYKIAILGTGQVGTEMIEKISKHKAKYISWYYHNKKPVEKVENVICYQLKDFYSHINDFDIIISALSIDKALEISNLKTDRNPIIIDLGIPRNFPDNFTESSVDLEKLKYWYRKEICSTESVLPQCNEIIEKNSIIYERIFQDIKNWNTKQ